MKLELKHLAPYLDTELKCVMTQSFEEEFGSEDWITNWDIFKEGAIWKLLMLNTNPSIYIPMGEGDICSCTFSNGSTYISFGMNDGLKPILRPLSDLTKRIEIGDGKGFTPFDLDEIIKDNSRLLAGTIDDKLLGVQNGKYHPKHLPYHIHEKMLAMHFDVFGLIDKGLAIDINTL